MLGHDLRFALRSLLRQRLASGLVVAMLAPSTRCGRWSRRFTAR
jgi:hypothetical protein